MTRVNNPFFELLKIENRPDEEIRAQLKKIFSSSIGPVNYFVVADGVTDCSTELQAAITDNNKLTLESGKNYYIDARLNLADDTHVDMNGATITLGPNADRAFLILGSNVTIENGTINGNNNGNLCSAAWASGAPKDNLTIHNITITDPKSSGIALTNCADVDIRKVHISWTAAGVTARAATSTSFYGLLATSSEATKLVENYNITDCTVDFSNFTAAQMQLLDSGFIIRGHETGSFINGDNIIVRNCRVLQPVGELDVTYGADLPRPTGIEIRTMDNVHIDNFYTYGGDLTLTHARIENLIISNCTSLEQTHYGSEFATGVECARVTNNRYESSVSKQHVTCSGTGRYFFTNCTSKGGLGDNYALMVLQNACKVFLNNCSIEPTVNQTDGIRLVNGPTLWANNIEFYTENAGAGWFVFVVSGTQPYVALRDCTFSGTAYGPIESAGTITDLRVSNSDGLTSLVSSVLTGVGTGQYNDNTGLTGL